MKCITFSNGKNLHVTAYENGDVCVTQGDKQVESAMSREAWVEIVRTVEHAMETFSAVGCCGE